MDIVIRGVGHGVVIDNAFHTRCCQAFRDLGGNTGGRDAFVCNDQWFFSAQGLYFGGNLFAGANADQGDAGNKIAIDLFLYCHKSTILCLMLLR